MTSYPMPGLEIHNKSGSKPLMQNPLPFLAHTALPCYHVHITWLGQLSHASFCFRWWMCDLQQRSEEYMIFITMAIVYYNNNNNLENHIRHVIWLGYNLYIILNKFNINKIDKN